MLKKKSAKGPGRLSAEEAAAVPDRLMDAAFLLFSRKGYADTSMEEIARTANASTKTIYSRYANKSELLKAVVERIITRVTAEHAAETSPDPAQVEPRRFLVGLGRRILAELNGPSAGLMQLALSEARRAPELARMYQEMLAMGCGNFRRPLAAWAAQGLLPELKDVERAASLCISLLTDAARIRVALGLKMSQAEIDDYIPAAVDLFLRGVGYQPR
ncbi:MAG TPA: TetR/AcrR family transcriptional regulator [Rhizomicrobium sp.]|jgi:TetR/AcrR family transcriptional repressor of mexJK operon|nr:TetR/AcrR family transcriptional regulator [Rhizomicrobium sp.]